MGIADFKKLRTNFLEPTSALELKEQLRNYKCINVFVDGSLYLFSGFTKNNQNPDGKSYHSEYVAETAAGVVYNKISHIRKYIHPKVNVIIYIDGTRPRNKEATSQIRKSKQKIEMNIQNCLFLFLQKLHQHNYILYNLILGEAEHEMVIRRSASIPSLFMTDDTDIFHITYGMPRGSSQDLLYTFRKDTLVYDLSTMDFGNMPKVCFTLLCHLRGSDFAPSVFTVSMVSAVIQAFKDYKTLDPLLKMLIDQVHSAVKESEELATYEKIQENPLLVYNNISNKENKPITPIYTTLDIGLLIKKLLFIAISSQEPRTCWPRKGGAYFCTHINLQNILNSITWAVNYSFIGAAFKDFFVNSHTPEKVDPYTFYNFIITLEEDVPIHDTLNSLPMCDITLDKFKKICHTTKNAYCQKIKTHIGEIQEI